MKIVSLSPSFTEIVEKLGRGDRLPAVTTHCPEIRPEIPRIGSPKALDLPGIAALKPDVILCDVNENRPEEIRVLQKDFKVTSFDVRSIPAVLDAVSAIGRLAEAMPEAEKLNAEIARERDAAQAAAKEIQPVRTIALLWDPPYLVMNFDTYVSRLIETCGAYNVFHEEPIREFPVDLEDLIEKNPQLLLLPKDPFPFKRRHIAKFRQYRIFSKIPIQLVDGKLFSRFGPRTADALKTFSALITEAAKQGVPQE